MGIFTRFKDIATANMNAMLDKAEDPEKMIKMMIREIEDTLVELKASCAGAIASRKKVQRDLERIREHLDKWSSRAKMAVSRGRDDLAREALVEKRRLQEQIDGLEQEMSDHTALVDQYREEIRQLEEKLQSTREKQRMLVQRHIHARRSKEAQQHIRQMDTPETMARFDRMEHRIEQMEAEADLVNYGRSASLDEQFNEMQMDEEIEKELQALKSGKTRPEDTEVR